MPNKIRQRQQARADLDAIWDYIDADNPDAADSGNHGPALDRPRSPQGDLETAGD
jgi:hypothetical protein